MRELKLMTVLALAVLALVAVTGCNKPSDGQVAKAASTAPNETPANPDGVAAAVWLADPVAAEVFAKEQGRPLLLYFWAEWSKACKALDSDTFPDPTVAARLSKWVTARVDLTSERPDLRPLQAKYRVQGLPTVVLVSSAGNWLEPLTLTDFERPRDFMRRLELAESGITGGADESVTAPIRAASILGGGYLDAKWGMTKSQVKAAMRIDPATPLTSDRADFMSVRGAGKTELEFWFNEDQLYQVRMQPNLRDEEAAASDAIRNGLVQTFGPGEDVPGMGRSMSLGVMPVFLHRWEDPETEIRYRVVKPSPELPRTASTTEVIYKSKKIRPKAAE